MNLGKTLNLSELNPSSREDGRSSKDVVSDTVATHAYGPVLGIGLQPLPSQTLDVITQGGPSSKRFYITPCLLAFTQQTFTVCPVLGDSAVNRLN